MATKKFLVMAGAVVITTGKKSNGKPEYARVVRGAIVNADPENEMIAHLVRRGALQQVNSAEEAERLRDPNNTLTAREAAKRAGADDDPVEAPQQESVPLPADLPETDPEALTADEADEADEAKSEEKAEPKKPARSKAKKAADEDDDL